VVVSQRLTSGSGSRRSASGSSEVGQLVGSLLSVVVDILSNGAIGNRLVRSGGVGLCGLKKRVAVGGQRRISHFDDLALRLRTLRSGALAKVPSLRCNGGSSRICSEECCYLVRWYEVKGRVVSRRK
jgi:hypothetical protein